MRKTLGLNKHQKAVRRVGEERVGREEIEELLAQSHSEDPEARLVAASYLCPCHVRRRIPVVSTYGLLAAQDNEAGSHLAIARVIRAIGGRPRDDLVQLWRRAQKKDEIILTQELPAGDRVFLRLTARDGHKMTFSTSPDGQTWTQVAPETPLATIVPVAVVPVARASMPRWTAVREHWERKQRRASRRKHWQPLRSLR